MNPDKEVDVEVEKKKAEEEEFATAKQLKMEGFKPKAIDELETDFEVFLKARNSKKAVDAKLKDARAKLAGTMKKHKQTAYGYKSGDETFVATLVDKEEVTVKTASKQDRS